MSRSTETLKDSVDEVVEEWARVRPDLDVTPSAVVIRLSVLAHRYQVALARFFSAHGLTKADFEVLATLRRRGAPYELSQHDIASASRRSSGTMSFRVDRLETEGFVRRVSDPDDARSVIVRLTERGRRKVDAVAPAHLDNERRLLSALDEREQLELARLLRKLVLSHDD